MAKALADSGHVVLRYDRRGGGQSGGRIEAATLSDYADDVISAVKWLSKRNDVDRDRIVVAGHGDGGAAALIAATRERAIGGVVTLNGSGTRGADFLLQQQQRVLDGMKLPPADRQARIDLQQKIQAAVTGGGSWVGVPEAMRRQADTPWFRSVLSYDPAVILPRVRQPMLIIQADQDPSVLPAEAEHLAEFARARRKIPPPEVVHLPDANQTLAPAGSRTVSPKVAAAIADWIKKL